VLCGESGDRRGVGDELRVIEDDKGVDMPIVPGRKCACILRPEVLIAAWRVATRASIRGSFMS
jgi:hypothetical protein